MLLKNTKPETVLMVAQLDFLILDKTKSGCEYGRGVFVNCLFLNLRI